MEGGGRGNLQCRRRYPAGVISCSSKLCLQRAHTTTGNGGGGGGIYNYQGTMTITNCTIYFNSSGMSEFATSGSGAGLANNGGVVNLHELTLASQIIEVGVSYGSVWDRKFRR